jgi:hypothetical protein
MRLLKLEEDGTLCLTRDLISDIPPYSILSHTWGEDDDEVTIADIRDGTAKQKPGYRKLLFCSEQARLDGLRYIWVDTCCIDKSNSTELSEAINSMFRWYQRSTKCYVYLSDVSYDGDSHLTSTPPWELNFRQSRWLSRGWTLQELLAPAVVEFYSSEGKRLGNKTSLKELLQDVTGIPIPALLGRPLHEFSCIERKAWSDKRQTKREEDRAYSLLGIFDVSLPLIYGEGVTKAFMRLGEEIDKRWGLGSGRAFGPGTDNVSHGTCRKYQCFQVLIQWSQHLVGLSTGSSQRSRSPRI